MPVSGDRLRRELPTLAMSASSEVRRDSSCSNDSITVTGYCRFERSACAVFFLLAKLGGGRTALSVFRSRLGLAFTWSTGGGVSSVAPSSAASIAGVRLPCVPLLSH